jgi:hypothetical protein
VYGIKGKVYFGNLELSSSIGQAVTNNNDEEFFTWMNRPSSTLPQLSDSQKKINPPFGSSINFFLKHTSNHNLFKVSYGSVKLNEIIKGQMAMVGDEINYGKFTFSAETMLIHPTNYIPATTYLDWNSSVNKGYSVTSSYRVLDTVKLSVNYNTYLLSQKSLDNARRGVVNNRDSYSDANAGVMWNVTDNLMLRGELHYMRGSRLLPSTETFTSNEYKSYYVGMLGFAYFFE